MQSKRRKTQSIDVNSEAPELLTSQFIEGISQLGTDFRSKYLKTTLLDKFVSDETDPPSVRRTRAISKWLATERNNEGTNVRLLTTDAEYNILPRVTFASFVEKARSIVHSIVGEMPSDDDLFGSFSGGATTSRNRTESHPASKYLGQADITEGALHYFSEIFPEIPVWNSFSDNVDFNVVRGNVLFTVPKSTNIDRCACKEPDINMFLQKGIGNRIRYDLRRNGIDLNDQSRNRELARLGSIDGSLATLDLSSASDSISCSLVELLMPEIWYSVLSSLRSPITVIDGEEHVNEMFSSMGNGFTFELESLLFYALARTTAYFRGISGVISVYGDDIIVPTQLSHDLIWILGYFGFEVNTSKSFISGPFRESCGGHFVNGLDVTPFYLRKPITHLTDIILMANKLREWACKISDGICDPEVFPLWTLLKNHIPKCFWGGREFSSITQLVSPDKPKLQMQPKLIKKPTGDGGYIHWLNATQRRQVASSIQTSTLTVTVHRYKPIKSRRTVTRLTHLFVEEIA